MSRALDQCSDRTKRPRTPLVFWKQNTKDAGLYLSTSLFSTHHLPPFFLFHSPSTSSLHTRTPFFRQCCKMRLRFCTDELQQSCRAQLEAVAAEKRATFHSEMLPLSPCRSGERGSTGSNLRGTRRHCDSQPRRRLSHRNLIQRHQRGHPASTVRHMLAKPDQNREHVTKIRWERAWAWTTRTTRAPPTLADPWVFSLTLGKCSAKKNPSRYGQPLNKCEIPSRSTGSILCGTRRHYDSQHENFPTVNTYNATSATNQRAPWDTCCCSRSRTVIDGRPKTSERTRKNKLRSIFGVGWWCPGFASERGCARERLNAWKNGRWGEGGTRNSEGGEEREERRGRMRRGAKGNCWCVVFFTMFLSVVSFFFSCVLGHFFFFTRVGVSRSLLPASSMEHPSIDGPNQ